MDLTAITFCMDYKIPLVVFNLRKQGNIARVIAVKCSKSSCG